MLIIQHSATTVTLNYLAQATLSVKLYQALRVTIASTSSDAIVHKLTLIGISDLADLHCRNSGVANIIAISASHIDRPEGTESRNVN